MGWDERLFDLLDDLEGQAEALYAAERDAELVDRSRAEYASVSLASRLMASVGRQVVLEVTGSGGVRGELRRVGSGWCLVSGTTGDWLVCVDAVTSVRGRLGSGGARGGLVGGVASRTGLSPAPARGRRHALPRRHPGRGRHEVELVRVGNDFVEAETFGEPPRRLLLALSAVGAVQSRDPR